jgi:protein-disulfide isomerase
MQNSGTPLIVAAVILAVAVLGGALILKSSMDAGTAQLEGVKSSLVEFKDALAAAARPQPAAAQRPSGPDPARKYSLNLNGTPVKGAQTAKVTLVEFSDFQCPFCKRVGPTLEQIEKTYGDKVRIAFKHLPLPMHPQAESAARAAEAAHRQGKFWEMHDKLFADQQGLSEAAYEKHAKELGLDLERFKKDYASPEVKARVDADMREANQLGVNGTPGFFVNGRFLSGAQPFEAFKTLIDQELAQAG